MKRAALILAALAAILTAAAAPVRTATESFVTKKIAEAVAATTNVVCSIVTNEVHSFGDWVEEWEPFHYGSLYSFSGPYYKGGETWSGFYHPKNGMGIDMSLTAVGDEFATRLVFIEDAGETSFTVTLTRSHVTENALGLARMSDLIAHTNRTDNPHGVTAEQIGAVPNPDGRIDAIKDDDGNTSVTINEGSGVYAGLAVGSSYGPMRVVITGGGPGTTKIAVPGVSITPGNINVTGGDVSVDGKPLGSHVSSEVNPHGVTAAQVGAYTKAEVDAKVENAVLPTDPAFSNAVLAVGLNIDTNSVAVLNEIASTFGGFPIEGAATTVGGLLAALAAAIAWLRKNKADKATTLAGYGITDGATKESLAPEYSPSSAYAVGAFVYHDGNIYQCKTEIADGGEAWNAAHWELRKLDDFFTESNSLLNGRLAYSRNATGLKDRAFNTLSFDGTEFNLSTALEAVTPTASGQPRDLLIVATATAATTIGYTAGTIKGDKPTIDGSGTWLITLTEYASGVWYCRQIKMEDAA